MALPTDLDIFGDGSCVELINFDGSLTTATGTVMNIVQDVGAIAPIYTNGAYGQGVEFDSLTGINATPNLGIGTDITAGWTLSIWFKENELPNFNEEFLDVFVLNGLKCELYATAPNELYVYSSGEVHETIVNAWDSSDLSVWHHFVVSCQAYDANASSVVEIYVDGVLVRTAPTDVGGRSFATDNRLDINVFNGAVNSGGKSRSYDQVRIFNRAVTQTEAGFLHDEYINITTPVCNSSENLLDVLSDGSCLELVQFNSSLTSISHGALTPSVSPTFVTGKFSTTAVQMTNSLELFGMSEFKLGTSLVSHSSISFFVNISSANASDIVLLKYGNIKYGDVTVTYSKASNEITATMGNASVTKIVTLDAFSHIVVTNDSTTLEMYIDAVVVSTAFTTRSSNTIDGIYIGSGDYVIDQLRLFDRALLPSDIYLISVENDCYFTQSSFIGSHASIFVQNSTNEAYTKSITSQLSSVDALTIASFSQQSTVDNINTLLFSQSSTNVAGDLVLGWFSQHSTVHEYQPYTDISSNYSFNGDSVSDLFTFNGTATSLNYLSVLSSTEALSFGSGKDGTQGIVANGTSVGTIDTVYTDAKWYSLWMHFGEYNSVSSDISIVNLNGRDTTQILIFIDTSSRLNITFKGVTYISLPNQWDNTPIQIVLSETLETVPGTSYTYKRILINNFLMIEGYSNSYYDSTGAFSMQLWGSGFIGVLDQFRYGNKNLDKRAERAIVWDSIAGDNFTQSSTTPEYTNAGVSQSSSVEDYNASMMKQSSSIIAGRAMIFAQKSTVFTQSLYRTFSQSQTLGEQPQTTMIERVL